MSCHNLTFQLNSILFFSILVPFCYTVDLSDPSTIMEGPATSTLHPPATYASQYPRAVKTSPAVSLNENAAETKAKNQNLNATDSGTLSKNNRKKSTMAGV